MRDLIGPIVFVIVSIVFVIVFVWNIVVDIGDAIDVMELRDSYIGQSITLNGDTLVVSDRRRGIFYLSNGVRIDEIIIEECLIK